jgi:two-component SAPR family response regulator
MTARDLAGCRILVVEDEMLIALMIEEAVLGLGCTVVGPAGKLSTALALMADQTFDAAILDVTIRGEKIYPVAEELIKRDIPFVFASGYGDWALPETMRDRPRLMKPFTIAALEDQIRALCEPRK